MSKEDQEHILQELTSHISDLVIKAHSSHNKETSGLFAEIKSEIKAIKTDIGRLEVSVISLEKSYKNDVLPNVKTWNDTSANQSKAVWIVMTCVIITLAGVIGLK